MGLARLVIVSLLACLCVPIGHASHPTKAIDIDILSSPRMDMFDAGDGLPNLTLVSISATDDGHVWAGTMRGLARYNGLRFVPEEIPGATNSFSMIGAVLALNKNQVWAAPANDGIYLWNGDTWRHFRAGQEFPGFDVRRLRAFNTRNGARVFATTNEGLVAVWDGKQWSELALNYSLRGFEIFDVLLIEGQTEQQDAYWIATYNSGLLRCQRSMPCSQVKVPGAERFFEVSSLRSIRELDGSTSLWAGSYGGGVARLNNGNWQRFTTNNSLINGNHVHDLAVLNPKVGEPELWAATRNGLSRFKDNKWQTYNHNQMTSSRVRGLSVSQDSQGHLQLWAATDNGAARLHLQSSWRTVSRLSENGNGIWSTLFEMDADGTERLWLGTDGDGLWRYENATWTQYGLKQGLAANVVRSLIRRPSGALWVGLWNGYIAEQVGDVFRTIETPWPKGERQAITSFLNDDKNGTWVALRERGVAHYDGQKWRWFDSKLTGAPEFVLGLSKTGSDADPVIWASSKTTGLGRFYKGQWQRFNTSNSELPTDYLATMQTYTDELNRTVLWLGSQTHGVIRLDVTNSNQPRLITSPALPKPPHPFVYGAVQNSKGDMVLCTDYGAAFWKKIGVSQFRAIDYHRADGLPHDECNAGALSLDRFDRAWVGTIGGAAVYSPESIQTRKAILNLERLSINNQEQDLLRNQQPFVASHANANIDLEFALFTGERESESRYRTQIIGVDESPGPWLQSNQRSFTKLPSGRYKLKIEAKDFEGRIAKPLEIQISVPTPWWRSWWAIALMVLVLVLILALFIYWRERQLRMREGQLVTLVEQRTGQLERRGKELNQMNEELRRLSYRDTLTGIANRRKLLELLDITWQDAQWKSACMAFILLDVDDFKAINDNYGHIRGDECLQLIAKQLESSLKDTASTLGRYGGEEFGIVLSDCNFEQAWIIAEKCRMEIERLQLQHAFSTFGVVTMSLGVAYSCPKPGETSEMLIAKADSALYLAKKNGKNRVERAS